jgi:8-oxo-dGTP pyrophosphatase MutT (NUDIX family)
MVLRRGDRFLVGCRAAHKRAPGYWTQVSGTVEPGETEPEAVKREAMEEIGCHVAAREKLQQLPSENGKYRLHYWRCEILKGEPAICNDELSDLRWVTVQELRQLRPVFQEDLDLFERLLDGGETGGRVG